MKTIVLFGAGVYAHKYKSMLDCFNIKFDYFTDNDESKIGTYLYGKEIISPDKLVMLDCAILISCTHMKAIEQQLEEMGIGNKIIKIDELVTLLSQKLDTKITDKLHFEGKPYIVVDMYEGAGWGGTEIWASTVAKGLADNGSTVSLLGAKVQPVLNQEYECLVERFSDTNTFEEMVRYMVGKLPFVLINNFSGYAYMIAVMLKKIYPDQVKIISVIHNDDKKLYNAHMVYAEYVDSFLCVSEKIRTKIIQEYGLNEKNVFFKEQPIYYDKDFERSYAINDRPIRIGYAARLVKQQKRADLFPELIKFLETKKINYELEIAGDGECTAQIEDFLKTTKLVGTVRLLGRLEKSLMPEFWKCQDVFLNFSEFEGTSLSMLEAMSYACVPVVTDVSGVSEFIKEEINGYVKTIGDLEGIASAIKQLDENREKLKVYGERCRHEILIRCRLEDYIQYMSVMIEGA